MNLPNHSPGSVQTWLPAGKASRRTSSRGWTARGLLNLAVVLVALLVALPVAAQEPAPDGTGNVHLPIARNPAAIACSCTASALDALPNGAPIPGQYLITMRSAEERAAASPNGVVEPLADFAQRSVAAAGGTVIDSYDTVGIFAAELSADAAARLALDPNVYAVDPNRVLRVEDPVMVDNPAWRDFSTSAISAQALPADTSTAGPDAALAVTSWGLDRVDQRDLPLNQLYAPYSQGAGVHAYILDTGVQWQNSEFKGRLGAWYTAVGDGNGFYDCDGHGTHVAGTVAGATYGLAPKAIIHPVRVLDACGSGTDAQVVAGINWVAANAQKPAVANMSLGGPGVSTALNQAVATAVSKGISFVVAAGNDGARACDYSPASTAPAITVGASDIFDFGAVFSNYGSCVDLYAPGVDIWSAQPGATPLLSSRARFDGTSMASPHVAGAVALYLATKPNATPAQVTTTILGAASTGRLAYLRPGTANRLLFAGGTSASTPAPVRPGPAACTNLLANGRFEQAGGWTELSTNGYDLIYPNGASGSAFAPGEGHGFAWLGGARSESSSLLQTISLPAGVPTTLSYWFLIHSDEDECFYDRGYAAALQGGEVVEGTGIRFCTATNTQGATPTGWQRGVVDLASYAGSAVEIEFYAYNDSSVTSSFLLDNVAVYSGWNCIAPTAGPAVTSTFSPEELEAGPVVGPAAPADGAPTVKVTVP